MLHRDGRWLLGTVWRAPLSGRNVGAGAAAGAAGENQLADSIWSPKLGSHRPLADGLLEVMQEVLTQQT
jgi:hypothetical protein